MAKIFDKVSQDFMNAIKGVLEAKSVNKHGHDEVGKEDEDIDNDGDSDKSDKYLHARRKAIGKAMMKKEEAEALDELSVGTMKKYRTAARADAMDADDVDDERRFRKRAAGSNTAGKKIVRKGGSLKEEEQIDELSTDTMRSYMDKASDARGHRKLPTKKVDNRYSGVQKASAKLAKEEVEQVDEISKAMAGRYVKKAAASIDLTAWRQGHKEAGAGNPSKQLEKKLSKRHKGIETAVKKLTKEDAEQIDEKQQYIEITNAHTNSKSYVPVHKTQAFAALNHYNSFSHNKRVRIIDKKEHDAIQRAKNPGNPSGMKEDAEQIDELSKKTMGSYVNKAAERIGDKGISAGLKIAADEKSSGNFKDMGKRQKGIATAVKKLTKEDAEQIDELSKKTLGSYVKKASGAERPKNVMSPKSVPITTIAAYQGDSETGHFGKRFNQATYDKAERLRKNRETGIKTAVNKLTKEEIEMIEAKMAGVAPGSMEGEKHMCATKVFHKEWNEGTPIKTMHADPDAEGLIEWYDVMFDHGIERVMTEDMEVLQAESHMHSKKKMKEGYVPTSDEPTASDKKTADKVRAMMAKEKMKEDIEQVDELSKNTMLRYVSANKKSEKAAQAKGDYSKSDRRIRGTDLAVRKYTATNNKYVRVPATEEVELDEARGRPKKTGQMDYTVHPITKEKLMHNNPEHMKKIEKLQKNKILEKPKTEASQHIMNQLQKAKTSMQGGSTIQFTHGQAKHVSGTHAAKLLDKYAGMKPDEKEAFQKKIGHSHEQLMKHV